MLTSQTQGQGGVWVVEFDPPGGVGLRAVSSHRQLVCSLDMVNRSRAPACSPVPGDAVLSPWEPDLRRYGPGRVTVAARDGFRGVELICLRLFIFYRCLSLNHFTID